MNSIITLLDPALKNNKGDLSPNLGDVIIHESVFNILKCLFPDNEIVRISTHSFLEKIHYKIIKESKYSFIGGSNLLSSDLKKYNQWKVSKDWWYYYLPGISRIILFGVGWWQYQHNPTFSTRFFYNSTLSGKKIHSVRDNYTVNKIKKMGIANVVNTSCPTTWSLHKLDVNKKRFFNKECLFTLTDYKPNLLLDNKLIPTLLELYSEKLYYFPQGDLDKEYIESLPAYKKNSNRICIIDRSISGFNALLSSNIDYVGTRLHGGIKCLQEKMDTLILATDNRAIEIGKDINLPVIERGDFGNIRSWVEGNKIFSPINLPLVSIEKWKSQFVQ